MSQLQYIDIPLALEELAAALAAQNLLPLPQKLGRKTMLPVGPACVPEPVDLAFAAGSANTLEAWGLREKGTGIELVCGEFDQKVLLDDLITPLRRALVAQRVSQALGELQSEAELGLEHQAEHTLVIGAGDPDDK